MPETATRRLTIAQALREAVAEEMRRDESVFLIGEDIGVEGGFGGAFGVYLGLVEEFGHDRIIDTPISEKAIAGAAVGSALAGMRPIADMQYSDFLFECMDELVNQAAKMRLMSGGRLSVPLVMRAPVGATLRGAQHGQSPESYFAHVPGLKVVCVSDAYHAKGLLKSAVRDDNPVLVFEHKLLYGSKGREGLGGLDSTAEVPEEEYLVPLGKAVVVRPGRDVTIVATHVSLYRSLAAAEQLAADDGIECEVIDPLTLLPLDTETILGSVRRTGRLVIVHEDSLTGGWGAEVAARAAEECFGDLVAPVRRIAALDAPIPFAPVLEDAVLPSVERDQGRRAGAGARSAPGAHASGRADERRAADRLLAEARGRRGHGRRDAVRGGDRQGDARGRGDAHAARWPRSSTARTRPSRPAR